MRVPAEPGHDGKRQVCRVKEYDYTPGDLSKLLNVSTNTIRRYDEKGYFNARRREENGYRTFGHADLEKLMYISKYRKVGFSHKDISQMLQQKLWQTAEDIEAYKRNLDAQIAQLQAYSHMLKDDIRMMQRARQYEAQMIEQDCSPMHYVLYQEKGKLCLDGEQGAVLRRFMDSCPEFKYIYLFAREDVLSGRLIWSEGVVANQLFTAKYDVEITPLVQSYERRPCVMQFVRIPLHFMDETQISQEQLRGILYDNILTYMQGKGYELVGDVIGIKVGYSCEEGKEWQYLLLSFPSEPV